MAINTGVNVSKVNAYAVLAAPVGVQVSKVNAYAVLAAPPVGVQVSKVNAYAVLTLYIPPPVPSNRKLTLPLSLIVNPTITWD